jgi:DOPA 4,5-dioxygenase
MGTCPHVALDESGARQQTNHNSSESDSPWNIANSFEELNQLALQLDVTLFHVHVHFSGYPMRKRAMRIREHVKQLARSSVIAADIGPLFDVPGQAGPHTLPSFEIQCTPQHLGLVLAYLTMHQHGLAILVHPLGVGEVLNHTERAFWLGDAIPLNLDYLRGVSLRLMSAAWSFRL